VKKKPKCPHKVPITEILESKETKEDEGAKLVLELIRTIEVIKKKIQPASFKS
jgi:hypothetical protein